jgi:multiple sugar transport system permease protein
MRATAIFTVLSVPLIVVLPLLIAVPLARKFPGRNFFRAVVFAPFVLGVAVVGVLWRYLLDPNVGVIASVLGTVGIDSPPSHRHTVGVVLAGRPDAVVDARLQHGHLPGRPAGHPASSTRPPRWTAPARSSSSSTSRCPDCGPVTIFVVTITILASANLFGSPT